VNSFALLAPKGLWVRDRIRIEFEVLIFGAPSIGGDIIRYGKNHRFRHKHALPVRRVYIGPFEPAMAPGLGPIIYAMPRRNKRFA
jgi:hypothetical protein